MRSSFPFLGIIGMIMSKILDLLKSNLLQTATCVSLLAFWVVLFLGEKIYWLWVFGLFVLG